MKNLEYSLHGRSLITKGLLFTIATGIFACNVANAFPAAYVNALQRAGYQLSSGDANGDGYPDVLVKAKQRIVFIDYDIPIPVVIKPASPTFVLWGNSSGGYSLDAHPSSAVVNSTVWQTGGYDLIFGDVLGSGSNSMLIRSQSAGEQNFMISTDPANGSPVLLQQLNVDNLGVDIAGSATTVALSDRSRDGRSDLVVRKNGLIAAVLIADAQGQFEKPSDSAGSAMAAWRGLAAALDAGDSQSALNFISIESVPKYSAAFGALGAAIAGMSQNWSDPIPVIVQSDFITFLVRETIGGRVRSYLVTLANEDGRWVIDEM